MDFYNYPHTNLNEQNQDWLIQQMKTLLNKFGADYANPKVINSYIYMQDKSIMYVYIGNEPGFIHGAWYYWDENSEAWTMGGMWGEVASNSVTKTLSSAGWYRVLKFTATSANAANGYVGSQIDIVITRSNGANTPENHSISLHLITGNIVFDNENSVSNSFGIDKIRYTSIDNIGYIDIHYSLSTQNPVTVNCKVYDTVTRIDSYTIGSLQIVPDAPSGETVLTTYDLTADGIRTITLTSMNSAVTINAQSCKRIGNVVNLWVRFTVSSDLSGYQFLFSAPTFAANINALTYNGDGGISNEWIYADAENKGLRCYDGIAAGTYVCYVSYITTDL